MNKLFSKIIGDKKEWKAMEARVAALPRGYRIVYREMKSYMWRFTKGDGMDIVAVLKDLIGLFEDGATQGKGVREVTGDNVAAFCDQRLSRSATYMDKWRTTINRDVAQKLAE